MVPINVCGLQYDGSINKYFSYWYICRNGLPYQQEWESNKPIDCDQTKNYTEMNLTNDVVYNCDGTPACPYVYVRQYRGTGNTCGKYITHMVDSRSIINMCGNVEGGLSYYYTCNSTIYNQSQWNEIGCPGKPDMFEYGGNLCITLNDNTTWLTQQVLYCGANKFIP